MGDVEQKLVSRVDACECSSPGPGTPNDEGVSMIGLLMVLLILGVLAAIAMSQLSGLPSTTTATTLEPGSAVTVPALGATPNAALVAACEADYRAIEVAIDSYRAINGSAPPAGTAWSEESSLGIRYLAAWPSDPHFSISWDGAQLSVVPALGTASRGSMGSSSPPSGCYAA